MLNTLVKYKKHWLELRKRTIQILCAYIVLSVITYKYAGQVCNFLISPLRKAGGDVEIIYLHIGEAFITYLRIALIGGFILCMPFIVWHIYSFIAPGLYKNERYNIKKYCLLSIVLFLFGGAIAYFIAIPLAWKFFLSFQKNENVAMRFIPVLGNYLALEMSIINVFGIVFQMPIVISALNYWRIININALIKNRKIAIVCCFIFAAILTPPDILSQICLVVPLLILYELSIILCKFRLRKIKFNCF